MTHRHHHIDRRPRGFWGWFTSLPALSKWGLINVGVQLGMALFALVAPEVTAAMAGGAALGFAAQVLSGVFV